MGKILLETRSDLFVILRPERVNSWSNTYNKVYLNVHFYRVIFIDNQIYSSLFHFGFKSRIFDVNSIHLHFVLCHALIVLQNKCFCCTDIIMYVNITIVILISGWSTWR